MATKKEQQEQRRWQLLSVSLELFVRRGYHGTSTRDISRAAGISSGLMFHYYPTKVHIYEALIAIGCEKMKLDFTQGLTDPLAFLQQVVEEMLELLKQSPFAANMFVLMGNAHFHKDISATANQMLGQHMVVEQSVQLIEQGQRLGQIKAGNPLALSMVFWNAIQGTAQELALHPDTPLPQAAWIVDIIRA